MKLLALAAVMMVSGTMVAGEAFDFNSPGPIAWKDPYYVKYKSGWMCTRELVEKRDTICFRMLESFHWAAFDCTKDSVVCRDVRLGAK